MILPATEFFRTNRDEDVSWLDQCRLVDDLYRSFEMLGIATLAVSRLASYRRIFEELSERRKSGQRATQQQAELVTRILVEVKHLETIAKAAATVSAADDWLDRLARLVSGSLTLESRSQHAPAFDAQFETFIAAVAVLSGYPVQFAEPDVHVTTPGGRLGIAAKRPKSVGMIESRCKSAARQIIRSGVPGIIALDLSFALYPHRYLNVTSQQAAHSALDGISRRVIATYSRRLARTLNQTGILGILVHLQVPAIIRTPTSATLLVAINWTQVTFVHDERYPLAEDFLRRSDVGLFGPAS